MDMRAAGGLRPGSTSRRTAAFAEQGARGPYRQRGPRRRGRGAPRPGGEATTRGQREAEGRAAFPGARRTGTWGAAHGRPRLDACAQQKKLNPLFAKYMRELNEAKLLAVDRYSFHLCSMLLLVNRSHAWRCCGEPNGLDKMESGAFWRCIRASQYACESPLQFLGHGCGPREQLRLIFIR